MHRQVGRVIDQQASWAKPLGEGAQELLKEVFEGRGRSRTCSTGGGSGIRCIPWSPTCLSGR